MIYFYGTNYNLICGFLKMQVGRLRIAGNDNEEESY